jgi:hypothetical protein
VDVHNKKFCLWVYFKIIPAEKTAAVIRSSKLESQVVVHIYQVVIQVSSSQVKSLTGLYFTWNLKQSLQCTWNTVHISRVLSSFCFQATCIQATWLVWTTLNRARLAIKDQCSNLKCNSFVVINTKYMQLIITQLDKHFRTFLGSDTYRWRQIAMKYEGWSEISGTEFIVGKRKHLQATQSYLLQSMTLQIVCSDSSDPSTFQCMSGRLIWEWPATAVSYLVLSPRRAKIVSPSGCSIALGRGISHRGPNLVNKAGGEPRGCCAWPRITRHSGPRGMGHCRSAEARYRKTICEAVSEKLYLEGVAERLCRQSDSWSGVGEETRDAPDPPCQTKRSSSSMDVRTFLNREYHSNVLDRLNDISPNACCSILYVSVAVLPSFWQNFMQTRCSFNISISQYGGGTNTTALYINQLTTESSCHPLLWYVASGDVAKCPTWLSLRHY